ncbi:hypothetical protein NQ315_008330 [Exocentrus adspersus]|uniref:Transposase n=1 Tax=Exocentrus adspersus TaxID=1586481 RepID=A0AAV8VB40_9CUCU|nr:hypothetical protein NQ315_008330 [Exocentrus adspersus]
MVDVINFPLLIAALQNENERLEYNRKKELRTTMDSLHLPENVFKQIYRFSKNTAVYLINQISQYLPDPARERLKIPKAKIILCALLFMLRGVIKNLQGKM